MCSLAPYAAVSTIMDLTLYFPGSIVSPSAFESSPGWHHSGLPELGRNSARRIGRICSTWPQVSWILHGPEI
ncbi:uncharacterized protein YALI1_E07429g [Yarrowia lipolytica]|uniref:Uncharacterized protein n=1 Tax=Yarrowia lipolytica TaxID=4952 RepID=A0A1D8NHC0_YARLL|nr:hypothetical protein YALI1_E07429g [Yarrowia lipolytica]